MKKDKIEKTVEDKIEKKVEKPAEPAVKKPVPPHLRNLCDRGPRPFVEDKRPQESHAEAHAKWLARTKKADAKGK